MAHKDFFLNSSLSLPHPTQTQSSQGGTFPFSQVFQPSSSCSAFAHTDSSTWNHLFSSDIPSTCCRLWRAQAITSFPSLCLAGLRCQAHRWYSVTPCNCPFPGSLFYDVFPFKCVEVGIHPSHYMFYSQHLVYVC